MLNAKLKLWSESCGGTKTVVPVIQYHAPLEICSGGLFDCRMKLLCPLVFDKWCPVQVRFLNQIYNDKALHRDKTYRVWESGWAGEIEFE